MANRSFVRPYFVDDDRGKRRNDIISKTAAISPVHIARSDTSVFSTNILLYEEVTFSSSLYEGRVHPCIGVINVYNVYKEFFVNAFIILSTFISIKIT